ncbi:MAG: hypothetical protein EXQ59_01675 [Acidobacteria bacterium]|nr:hypothetical protein [Acidobacteriota bacterium]
MTEWAPIRKSRSVAVGLLAVLCASGVLACAPQYVEIPIETPIQPKLDVSAFQGVLVVGFVAGGTEDIDANQETTRLLRSQLRSKAQFRVIDADVLPLADIVKSQAANTGGPAAIGVATGTDTPRSTSDSPGAAQTLATPIKNEEDMEPYERLFANTAYWKQIGEEYQNPLIVTGTVLFMERSTQNMVTRQNERLDAFGRRQVDQDRVFRELKGYVLRPKFIFIDGRTGATMHTETHREEVLYGAQQNMPALSSYFELMDRLVPGFLGALSNQKIRGVRVLLKRVEP